MTQKLEASTRELWLSRLGDTADDLDIVVTTARSLLSEWPNRPGLGVGLEIKGDATAAEGFDIIRVKLVDFILFAGELSNLLRARQVEQKGARRA